MLEMLWRERHGQPRRWIGREVTRSRCDEPPTSRVHGRRAQITHGTSAMFVGEGPLLGILSMLHTMLRFVTYAHFFV
jgi:hypothetical protein